MNLYQLHSDFWRANEVETFTPSECQFYFFLLDRANAQHWAMPIRCPTGVICNALGTTKQNIGKVRTVLQRRGLISFVPGQHRNAPTTYTIIAVPERKGYSQLSNQLPNQFTLYNNIKDNNHNTIREKAVFSLLELQELLAKDKEWHRQMTVYFELQHLKPPDDFLPYFQEFFVHLGAKGYKEREETECKSHFHSWLNKKLQRQPIYDTQQPTTNQCSQRRGTPVAAKSAADYEGAF